MNTPKASVGAPKDVQEPVPSSRDHKEESKEHNDVKNDKKDKTEKKKSKEKERKDREKKAVLLGTIFAAISPCAASHLHSGEKWIVPYL